MRSKRILILETERYNYLRVISDIAGQDINSHNDDPRTLILRVRNWISGNMPIVIASHNEIWIAFNQFVDDLSSTLASTHTAGDI